MANHRMRIAVKRAAPEGAPRLLRPLASDSRPSASQREAGAGMESEIGDADSLDIGLRSQAPGVAALIASRNALRTAPLAVRDARKASNAREVSSFRILTSIAFRASAIARVAVKYPARANALKLAALVAAARASASDASADASRAAVGWAILGSGCSLAAAAAATEAASVSMLAAPGLSAPSEISPSAIRLDAPADASFTAAYATADPALRAEIAFDVAAANRFGVGPLADLPLWLRTAPEWAHAAWNGLRSALPQDEGWEVWIDWYEDRLSGGSAGEDHELAFVRPPLDVWDKGPAAGNAWITARLLSERNRRGGASNQLRRSPPGGGFLA